MLSPCGPLSGIARALHRCAAWRDWYSGCRVHMRARCRGRYRMVGLPKQAFGTCGEGRRWYWWWMYSRGEPWQHREPLQALFSFFFSACDYARLLHTPSPYTPALFFRRCLPALSARPATPSDGGGAVGEQDRITRHHFAVFGRDSFRYCFSWGRRDVFCDHGPY